MNGTDGTNVILSVPFVFWEPIDVVWTSGRYDLIGWSKLLELTDTARARSPCHRIPAAMRRLPEGPSSW